MKNATIMLTILLVGCSGGANVPTAPVPPVNVTPPPPPPPPPPPVTCTVTIHWENPTEDIDDNPLSPTELTEATIYAAAVPYAPMEWTLIIGKINPYGLAWELRDVPAGIWYYELTVSNAAGESGPANLTEECS